MFDGLGVWMFFLYSSRVVAVKLTGTNASNQLCLLTRVEVLALPCEFTVCLKCMHVVSNGTSYCCFVLCKISSGGDWEISDWHIIKQQLGRQL